MSFVSNKPSNQNSYLIVTYFKHYLFPAKAVVLVAWFVRDIAHEDHIALASAISHSQCSWWEAYIVFLSGLGKS